MALLPKRKDFLRVDDNKTSFSPKKVIRLLPEEGMSIYYANDGGNVFCSMTDVDMSNLVPCSHEEADTHLLLHEADADMSNLVPCSHEEADTHFLMRLMQT